MRALPEPTAEPPIMFGAPAPPGGLLPWSWAEERLRAARTYWIATTRAGGQPHCRPVWGVWLADGFWFSTGSLTRVNLARDPTLTVHLEDGQEVVIVEGTASTCDDEKSIVQMCRAYSAKYDYPISLVDGEVRDSSGTGGPAYRAVPRKVIGWASDMTAPTRWMFAR